ncbi:DUF4403 family protein [Flavitalea sp. BT771]|uniref:DUF4403 family protein n=1 Tax=Flavitalea sp. BT771 TaxID=3063329 RepID=UPI0026E3CE9F|nr:DUF4403 family protein [Flavitalea sp. BT771]MDO6429829.1 DUF4403 family protein [Flavitalea sp. BT771]MDV6218043.1 DUF4403 family protein [Flavitalea sp. BT771]
MVDNLRKRSLIWLLLLAACICSCSSSKKISARSAISALVPDSLPPLPASEIDLPLKVAGRPLIQIADTIVPKEFTSEGWPSYLQTSCELRYKYRFVRTGFNLSCTNNKIFLQMGGSYQVAGGRCLCAMGKPVSPWISGNCGFGTETMRKVDINLSSQLTLLPNYKVRTITRLDQLKTQDKCVMSVFSMDMTQMIVDSIRSSITSFCSILDQTLAGLDFTGYLHHSAIRAWQRMPLGPYGYLVTNPLALRVGPLNYIQDTFRINIGLTCRPQLTSESDVSSVIPPLPPLTSNVRDNGISLYLGTNYDYGFISKLLNDTLKGRSFLVKGQTITIKDLNVKGIGHHQVELTVDFGGSRRGQVRLWGTPVLDPLKQALTIPDLKYTLDGDMMIVIARTFFKKKIRKNIQGSSFYDLAAMLKANMPLLDAQLNRTLAPNLYTRGNIKELKMIGLLAGDKSLQAQLFVKADLSVTSTGL